MPSDDTPVADILTEFLEAAIHNILRVRKLYPEVIFSQMQKYGCGIFKSIHPQLNEYIQNCIGAIYYFAKMQQLSKVAICFTKHNKVLEKIVFDIHSLKDFVDNDPYLVDTEQSFRNFFLKLIYRSSSLKPLEDDVNFTIMVYTTKCEAVKYMSDPQFQSFPWIHVDQDYNEVEGGNILPLLTVEKNNLNFQVYMVLQVNEDVD